jgi:hypothetical protein
MTNDQFFEVLTPNTEEAQLDSDPEIRAPKDEPTSKENVEAISTVKDDAQPKDDPETKIVTKDVKDDAQPKDDPETEIVTKDEPVNKEDNPGINDDVVLSDDTVEISAADEDARRNETITDDVHNDEGDSKETTKKRKKSNADQESSPTKKHRVKPEKVKEVYNKIIHELSSKHSAGLTNIPLKALSLTVGYKNPRSDAFADAIKLLCEDGMVEKTKEDCSFSEAGRKKYTKETKPAENREEAWQMFWDQYDSALKANPKAKSAKAREAASIVWNKLKDGKGYTRKVLVGLTEYKGINSTGFEGPMACLNNLGFIQTNNTKISFTDKMFPFGRP